MKFRVISGAFIGFAIALLDLVLIGVHDLSLEELLFISRGDLNLSAFSYMLMVFVPIGGLIGAFSFICKRPISRCFPTLSGLSHFLFCAVLLTCIVIGLKLYRVQYIHFGSLLFFVLSVIFFVAFLTLLTSGKRVRFKLNDRSLRILMSLVLTVGPALSIIGPVVYLGVLRASFNPPRNNSGFPNIILIVLDAVRVDHLSCYGYPEKSTPYIDDIAKGGALFLEAFSPAPWTLPSHASIFTGLYQSQHRADWEHPYLDNTFLTLAEYLRNLGYRTVGLTENPFVSRNRGLAQGFDDFYEMYVYRIKAVGLGVFIKAREILLRYMERKEYAKETLRQFRTWILKDSTADRPFFAFMNLMAAHLPNYPRPGFVSGNVTAKDLARIEPVNQVPERFYIPTYRLSERELEIMEGLYHGEIRYLDARIGELVDFLKDASILDNTILVITSDHGENFGDHGLIEHQLCVYDSLLHVPLIIRFPKKINPGQIIARRVSTISIFPTILEIVSDRSENGVEYVEDRTLFRGYDNRAAIYAEYANAVGMLRNAIGEEAPDFDFDRFDRRLKCIYEDGYKFIWSSNGKHELYKITDNRGETENLVSKEPQRVKELNARLASWQQSLWKPKLTEETPKMDAATKKALRSLGYVK
ncbi:MAG: sulfatase [Candidatus Hodarchaeota archaeon]